MFQSLKLILDNTDLDEVVLDKACDSGKMLHKKRGEKKWHLIWWITAKSA